MYQQSEKNLLSSNISSTCPHNMVNFGPLAAEMVSLVWGTPANFNGFRVLAALLHGILVVGVSQTAALNRRRHLYSAGRPSRWALAHILVFLYVNLHDIKCIFCTWKLVKSTYCTSRWCEQLAQYVMCTPVATRAVPNILVVFYLDWTEGQIILSK